MSFDILIFAAIFGLLVILYNIAIFLRTKVPIILSPKQYIEVLLSSECLNIQNTTLVYEMGSASGNFSFEIEKKGPKKVIAYELSPIHVFYARLKAKILKSKVEFVRKDFFLADLRDADIVYAFLVSSIVNKLWKKMKRECRPGTLLVVLSDEIEGEPKYKAIKTNPNKKYSTFYNIYKI